MGATVSGGSNIGSGTPTVTQSGGKLVLTVPGTVPGGTTGNFPTITATFQATGSSGTALDFKYAGTSYSDPGLTFQTRVNNVPLLGSITTDSSCYAQTNPVLATVTIN